MIMIVFWLIIVVVATCWLCSDFFINDELQEVEATVKWVYLTGRPWELDDEEYTMRTGRKVWGMRFYHITLETSFGEKKLVYNEYKLDGEESRDIRTPDLGSKMKVLTTRFGKEAFWPTGRKKSW